MSKLDELINKLCPNGVEFKKIEEVCDNVFAGGTPRTSNQDYYGGNIPWLRSGEINFNIIDDAEIKITEKGLNKSSAKWIKEYSVLIAMTGATVARSAVNIKRITANQSVCAMEPSEIVNYKYLYYYIESMYNNIKGMAQGALTSINLSIIKSISIPVPPLEVQCEIVRILDNFTLLSAELSAELSARQKQYDYYKQKVLDDIKTNNIKHITDIALVKARVGWQRLTRAEYLYEGNYFLITGTDFVADGSINFDTCVYISKDRYDMDQNIQVHKDDILITKDGTLGKVAILKDEPPKETTLNSGVFRISVLNKQEVYPQYLYHYFTSKYFKDFVESVKTGSTIPHLTQQGLVTLDIPIPELNEQVKISNLLDKFDKLCNDLSEGLPAEIEARKKQYEFYRDKLLTFKELK